MPEERGRPAIWFHAAVTSLVLTLGIAACGASADPAVRRSINRAVEIVHPSALGRIEFDRSLGEGGFSRPGERRLIGVVAHGDQATTVNALANMLSTHGFTPTGTPTLPDNVWDGTVNGHPVVLYTYIRAPGQLLVQSMSKKRVPPGSTGVMLDVNSR